MNSSISVSTCRWLYFDTARKPKQYQKTSAVERVTLKPRGLVLTTSALLGGISMIFCDFPAGIWSSSNRETLAVRRWGSAHFQYSPRLNAHAHSTLKLLFQSDVTSLTASAQTLAAMWKLSNVIKRQTTSLSVLSMNYLSQRWTNANNNLHKGKEKTNNCIYRTYCPLVLNFVWVENKQTIIQSANKIFFINVYCLSQKQIGSIFLWKTGKSTEK